jgi:hypothetical protein
LNKCAKTITKRFGKARFVLGKPLKKYIISTRTRGSLEKENLHY